MTASDRGSQVPPNSGSRGHSRSVLSLLRAKSGVVANVALRSSDDEIDPVVQSATPKMRDLLREQDHYEVLGEIARGGMGSILRVHDRDLGRDVAMKVLLEKHARDPSLLRRFADEAQIAGQLQHPGIIPVYEFGLQADDMPYFTMKLVKGRTLAAILAERADLETDRRRLLRVFAQICETMAYAHARKVVHRDLKPSNVMVGAFGEVQVLDWGFAKVMTLDRSEADDPMTSRVSVIRTLNDPASGTHSIAGSVLGTPAYMPPEQALGRIELLDERSDVFALGAILCEVLIGQPPYVGDAQEVMLLASEGRTSAAFTKLDELTIDEEVVALCKHCLATSRAQRPQHAGEVAERLRQYESSAETRRRRAEKEAERARVRLTGERKARRLVLAIASVVLAAVILIGGGYGWELRTDAQARARTQIAVQRELEAAGAARGRAQATGALADWHTARADAERAVALLDEGPSDPTTRERASRALTEIRAEQQKIEDAAKLELRNRTMIARLQAIRIPRGDTTWTDSDSMTGEMGRRDVDYRKAFAQFDLAPETMTDADLIAALRASPIIRELAAALDYWGMAKRALHQSSDDGWRLINVALHADDDEWRHDLRNVLLIGAKDPDELHRLAHSAEIDSLPPETLSLCSEVLADNKLFDDAVHVLQVAQRRRPDDFLTNYYLGWRLLQLAPPRYEQAARYLAAARALQPDIRGAGLMLASALVGIGLGPEARALVEETLREAPDDVDVQLNYTAVHFNSGDGDGAVGFLRSKLDGSVADGVRWQMLGQMFKSRGETDLALNAFQEAFSSDGSRWQAELELATMLVRLERLDEAEPCFKAAALIAPEVGWIPFSLGNLYEKRGQSKSAIEQYFKAFELDHSLVQALDHIGTLAVVSENGLVLLEKLDAPTAVRAYELLQGGRPLDWRQSYKYGYALAKLGRIEDAVRAFESSVRLQPDSDAIMSTLGKYLSQLGRHEEALVRLQAAIRIDPRDPLTRRNLADVYMAMGSTDQAISAWHEVLLIDPTDMYSLRLIHDALAMLGRLSATSPADMASAQMELTSAFTSWETGDEGAAQRSMRNAITAAPHEPGFELALSRFLCITEDPTLRDPTAAIQHAQESLICGDHDIGGMLSIALALLENGKLDLSTSMLDRTIHAHPQELAEDQLVESLLMRRKNDVEGSKHAREHAEQLMGAANERPVALRKLAAYVDRELARS